MKKLTALILALAMALAACCALADDIEVQPGSPSGCSYTLFKTMFDAVTSASNYQFTWGSAKTAEGAYDVYTCTSSDGLLTLKVYVSGDNVSHVTGEGSTTFSSSTLDNAQKLGEWFGATLAGTVFSIFMMEGGDTTDSGLMDRFQQELLPLTDALNDMSDEAITKGVAVTTNVLGYPCGLVVSGSAVGSVGVLNMKLGITSSDGSVLKTE